MRCFLSGRLLGVISTRPLSTLLSFVSMSSLRVKCPFGCIYVSLKRREGEIGERGREIGGERGGVGEGGKEEDGEIDTDRQTHTHINRNVSMSE